MTKQNWKPVATSREGRFGEFWVRGWPYEDDEGNRAWHTKSWPEAADAPVHNLFVDGDTFMPVTLRTDDVLSGQQAVPVIEDRLVSVHPAEKSAILKAISEWESE